MSQDTVKNNYSKPWMCICWKSPSFCCSKNWEGPFPPPFYRLTFVKPVNRKFVYCCCSSCWGDHKSIDSFIKLTQFPFAQFSQLAQFPQNRTDPFKIAQCVNVAQICSKLRKVAKIHTKSLKVAQICPNYTLTEILLIQVWLEKCDPWSIQVWSNLQIKPLQLYICWYFAQKSATLKVWPTNYIELKN